MGISRTQGEERRFLVPIYAVAGKISGLPLHSTAQLTWSDRSGRVQGPSFT